MTERDEAIIKELNKYINDLNLKSVEGENSKLIMLSLVSVLKNIMKEN